MDWLASLVFERTNSAWDCTGEYGFGQDGCAQAGFFDSFAALGAPREITTNLSHAVYLRLNANNVMKPSYSDRELPRVEADGRGVATTFGHYLKYDRPRADAVLDGVRCVVPDVKAIRVGRALVPVPLELTVGVGGRTKLLQDSQEVWGDELIFDMKTGDSIPAHACSEGTLLCVALLTALNSEHLPHLVLLDDIETALHPTAQRQLVDVLKALLSSGRIDGQIVVTTHSPYIVDQLEPEHVWAFGLDSKGFARPQRLSDHPDADTAKKLLTTGEMWSAYGEDWSDWSTSLGASE